MNDATPGVREAALPYTPLPEGPAHPASDRALERATGLVGRTEGMSHVHRQIDRYARTTATVLVRGETGTGKELVARALHARSPRAARPFVAANVAALPASMLASELFGHERGAFTEFPNSLDRIALTRPTYDLLSQPAFRTAFFQDAKTEWGEGAITVIYRTTELIKGDPPEQIVQVLKLLGVSAERLMRIQALIERDIQR